jgi:hypothetical protein
MLFLESPWPILIVGLVLETLLAVALFQTRKGKLLWAMGGVAVLVLIGVLIERNTITDTKLVRQTLESVAAGLRANNREAVYACIVPGPDGGVARGRTDWALGFAEFHEFSIRNLDVTFNYHTSPPTADADFVVIVRGTGHGSNYVDLGEITRPVRLQISLRKTSGRWLIYGNPRHDVHELGGELR